MKVLLSTTLLSLSLAIFAAASAFAQATIADCEKIQAADAYNQCLAKFGPPGKTLNVESPRPGDVKTGSDDAAATGGKASGRRHGRGKAIYRRGHVGRATHGGRHGRKRFSIPVGK